MTPISTIRNLGPAMEAAFAKVGVGSAEELRALGADAAYERLLRGGGRPHFIPYYVLHMALQGRPWNDCTASEKGSLRATFEGIKARCAPSGPSAIEAALDALGVEMRRV